MLVIYKQTSYCKHQRHLSGYNYGRRSLRQVEHTRNSWQHVTALQNRHRSRRNINLRSYVSAIVSAIGASYTPTEAMWIRHTSLKVKGTLCLPMTPFGRPTVHDVFMEKDLKKRLRKFSYQSSLTFPAALRLRYKDVSTTAIPMTFQGTWTNPGRIQAATGCQAFRANLTISGSPTSLQQNQGRVELYATGEHHPSCAGAN